MILILSKEIDQSTDEVISWLLSQGKDVLRMNNEDDLSKLDVYLGQDLSRVLVNGFDISSFDAVWVRKGQLPSFPILDSIQQSEFSILKEYVLSFVESQNCTVGSILGELGHNKVLDLHLARSIGLMIPETYVTTSKRELVSILNAKKRIIIKPLKDCYRIEGDENVLSLDIFVLEKEMLDSIEDVFFPTLIQEYLLSKFEVRVFAFKDRIFSTAIFVDSGRRTSVSGKVVDRSKLNRMVSIKLPVQVLDKIRKMLNLKGLSSASVDLIYSQGHYFFLEINPVGQFDWISKSCNFYIEKYISENL